MSEIFPNISVSISPRRWPCVLDPSLALSRYGLAVAGRLGGWLELWVVRELWHILDNTHFYRHRPGLLSAAAPEQAADAADPSAGEALQALGGWERLRFQNDLAGLKLYWVGDDPGSSLLPPAADPAVVWRYEALACALEHLPATGAAATLP